MTRQFLATLLEASIRSAALAGLVAAVVVLARVRVGGVRHAMWTAALAGMLAMPLLPMVVPAVRIRVPDLVFRIQVPAPAPSAPQSAASVAPPTETLRVVRPATGQVVPAIELPTPPTSAAPVSSEPIWPGIVLSVYLLGALVMLTALIPGAVRASRLRRHGRAIQIPGARAAIAVSDAIASPMTVGIVRPVILLPLAWSTWSAPELAAVLAHEHAHVRRRDGLVLLAASLNRSVFWFHPLAWWLARTLATSAEYTCDEAGARAMGERGRYAELLLQMAKSVRRRRGRVAWSAVGINGGGLLDRRISHILSEPRGLSTRLKATLALACASAIFLVAACRNQSGLIELKEDPELAANLARQRETQASWDAAQKLSLEQVAVLEAKLKQDPEDRASRRTLLVFYQSGQAQKLLGAGASVAAKRAHALWLVEHRPDDELVAAYGVNRDTDPAGYEEIRKLWLLHVAKPNLAPRALGYAAYFFQVDDKPLAEQLLLRAKAAEPDGAAPRVENGRTFPRWSGELGRHYALVVAGATQTSPGRSIREVSAAEANSPYALEVRKKLDASTDALLLQAVGHALRSWAAGARDTLAFDVEALALSYLRRAAEIDPSLSARAFGGSGGLAVRTGQVRQSQAALFLQKESEIVGGEVARKLRAKERLTREDYKALSDAEPVVLAAMPETERFANLPRLAVSAYSSSNSADYYDKDAVRAKALRDRSKQYSRELLTLARKFPADPRHGDAIYHANLVLALAALREGDAEVAVDYMGEAAKAGSLTDDHSTWIVQELMIYLLEEGERESVASFLDRAAAIGAANQAGKVRDAAAIRAGRMPPAYQHRMTRAS